MPFDRSRLLTVAVLAGFVLVAVPAARAQESEDHRQSDSEPCDGKARLRGPVFATKSGQIEPEALVTLDVIAEKIKRDCRDKQIVIEGHTDTFGDPGYNQRLSEVRAREIKRLLVERGVPADQLETVGYGEQHPITTSSSPAEQALNRRISFVTKDRASHPLPANQP